MSRKSSRGDLAVLIFCMVFPTVATWLYFVQFAGGKSMAWLYTLTKIVQFAVPVLWLRSRSDLTRRVVGPVHLPGLLLAIFSAAVVIGVYLLVFRGSPMFEGFDVRLRQKVEGMHAGTPMSFIALGAFISIIHSFLEEYYWRLYVYGHLRGYTTGLVAGVVSALAFTAHHVVVLSAYLDARYWWLIAFFSFAVFVAGAFWAWQYQRTGKLTAPWASHIVVDAALMVVGYNLLWG